MLIARVGADESGQGKEPSMSGTIPAQDWSPPSRSTVLVLTGRTLRA